MERAKPLRIVCAAVKAGDVVACGIRHYDEIMSKALKAQGAKDLCNAVQGFVDSYGTFHDRKDAMLIAKTAGQVTEGRFRKEELFSEDLY